MRGCGPDHAIFTLDPAGTVLSWTASASRVFGYGAAEIIGCHFSLLYPEKTRQSEPGHALEIAANQPRCATEGWQVRKDRSRFWATMLIERLYGEAEKIIGFATVISPGEGNEELENRVEERTRDLNAANVALQHLADTDELTGIFNLRGFMAAAEHELARSSRYKRPLCLLFLDIDKFKMVNDTFGHAAGDRALKMVVEEMGRQLREGDIMARIGGDEFVMLLRESTSEEAAHVADRICEAVVSATTEAVGGCFTTTVSVGVAQWSPKQTIEQFIARADAALYSIKSGKKERVPE